VLRTVWYSDVFPKTGVMRDISTSFGGVRKARLMARTSSTPGSVSMMSFRGIVESLFANIAGFVITGDNRIRHSSLGFTYILLHLASSQSV